jgi:hypothetical protein
MNIKIVLLASLALAIGFLPGRAQNLILNSGFESPSVPTTSVLGLGIAPGAEAFTSPSTGITDWSVTQGTVSVVDAGSTVTSFLGLLNADAGSQYAVLNGLSISGLGVLSVGSTGTLAQSFATTANQTYVVSFAYTGLSVSVLGGTAELQVNVSGATNSTAPNGGLLNISLNSWQTETFDFTATGSSSTLSFDEPSGSLANADGVGLDAVSVTPVPEPRQYAAAAVGFLALLIAVRILRRHRGHGPLSPGLA